MGRCNSAAGLLTRRGKISAAGLWVAMVLAVGAQTAAAQVPADALFRGFHPDQNFFFELGGKTLKHAEIYLSDRAAAYLVVAPELPAPLLVNLRAQSVETVSFMKVVKREDGTIDLLADASFSRVSGLQLGDREVVFQVNGQTAKVKPRR
jgi:hypothetical protein